MQQNRFGQLEHNPNSIGKGTIADLARSHRDLCVGSPRWKDRVTKAPCECSDIDAGAEHAAVDADDSQDGCDATERFVLVLFSAETHDTVRTRVHEHTQRMHRAHQYFEEGEEDEEQEEDVWTKEKVVAGDREKSESRPITHHSEGGFKRYTNEDIDRLHKGRP